MIRSDKKKYLYAKEHIFKEGSVDLSLYVSTAIHFLTVGNLREDQDGAGRTLFVTNLAYDCTKVILSVAFVFVIPPSNF